MNDRAPLAASMDRRSSDRRKSQLMESSGATVYHRPCVPNAQDEQCHTDPD